MNEDSKQPSIPADNQEPQQPEEPNEQPSQDILAADLQKIEGYETATVVEATVEPIANVTPPAPTVATADLATLPESVRSAIIPPNGPKKHSNKKKKIIIGVASVFILALFGGGWATYALWYQNPDKVITDALFNVMTAKTFSASGSMDAKASDGSTVNLKLQGQGGYKEGFSATATMAASYKGNKINLGAQAVRTSGGDYYFAISGLKAAYNSYMNSVVAQMEKQGYTKEEAEAEAKSVDAFASPIVSKLDNQWVRFAVTDIKKYDKDLADEYDCANKVITGATNDKSELIEMGTLYQKRKVLVVTQNLGQKDGALGYVVHIDNHEMNLLTKDLENTKFYRDLKACDKSSSDESSDSTNFSDTSSDSSSPDFTRMEVWVDQWTHALRRLYVTGSSDGGDAKDTFSADFSFTFGKPTTVKTPSGSKSIDELFPDLTKQIQGVQGTQSEDSTQQDSSSSFDETTTQSSI